MRVVAFVLCVAAFAATPDRPTRRVLPSPEDDADCAERSDYSGWNSASVFPSGSLSQADLPMPAVVATWFTVFSVGKS